MSNTLPSRDSKKATQRKKISNIISSTKDCHNYDNIVYVIECQTPDDEKELKKFKKAAGLSTDYVGYDYVTLIADKFYYVGWTNRPTQRILVHLRGEKESARFTKIYQPIAIEEIRWFESEKKAKEAEELVTKEYNDWSSVNTVDLDSVETNKKEVEWCDIVSEIKEFERPNSFAHSF